MKIRIISTLFIGIFLVLSLVCIRPVYAALGGSADSIAEDKKALKSAQSAIKTSSKYSVHEIYSAANNVREYVSPSGVVFGIAWNGMSTPDLTFLLGSYAPEHKKAAARIQRQHGQRQIKIKTNNIIVERWGHMRNLKGRAYVPALIPEGVSVDEIK